MAIRNLGQMEFPITATVFADTVARPRKPPQSLGPATTTAAASLHQPSPPIASLRPPLPATPSQTAARRKPPRASASLSSSRLFSLEAPSADCAASALVIQVQL